MPVNAGLCFEVVDYETSKKAHSVFRAFLRHQVTEQFVEVERKAKWLFLLCGSGHCGGKMTGLQLLARRIISPRQPKSSLLNRYLGHYPRVRLRAPASGKR